MSIEVKFLNKVFKNPIIPASGTFGFGYEFCDLYDINILGSIAFTNPDGHSAIRGNGFPYLGSKVVPFNAILPKMLISYKSQNS